MSAITEKQAVQREAAARKRAEEEADMLLVARLFSTPDGERVLELMMRRFGVLAPRFVPNEKGELSAIRAGKRDGQAEVVLWVLQCLRVGGKERVSFGV
ncbi:hypothetical protein [Luteolibacter sp. Populi]|uniref:Bbp19 family protein n=1 Tax=Luteolibacter sp. Populi TaxID=3230487 RepID=UPI00346590BF